MGIVDLVKTTGSSVILAVTAPKNDEALGDQFFSTFGLKLPGRWNIRKPKLMGHLHQCGTECLIVDDAHDLSLEHLMFLKEVTDQGRLQYDHPLGLCLVAAACGDLIAMGQAGPDLENRWRRYGKGVTHVNQSRICAV